MMLLVQFEILMQANITHINFDIRDDKKKILRQHKYSCRSIISIGQCTSPAWTVKI